MTTPPVTPDPRSEPPADIAAENPNRVRARAHESGGWWALVAFVSFGVILEALHGFKVSWYLDAGEETRRLMWRLAHAHGTFLSLVQLAFAATLRQMARTRTAPRRIGSPCLIAASLLIPSGFLLGGIDTYGADPGPGIALLPLGAVLLLVALVTIATSSGRPE